MNGTTKKLNFQGQNFYIGLDVHKNNWSVTIKTLNIQIKPFSMNPSPKELSQHLNRKYPGGNFYTVYEAGFCGFWIHRELEALGIHNVVTNPADVPSRDKEKRTKTDPIDSTKLARELFSGSLEAIYVPDPFHESFRSLVRLRHKTVSHQTRIKNRIKGYLTLLGIHKPQEIKSDNWTREYLQWLEHLSFSQQPSDDYLRTCLEELKYIKSQLKEIKQQIKIHVQQEPLNTIINKYIMSVPGIGFTTAVSFYSEVMDIHRFPKFDNLASFVGFVPNKHTSGERDITTGITHRKNSYLRHYLVEAAWKAIELDPALLLAFEELTTRMTRQKAIIRIAKKLLNRIRHVWKNKQVYVNAVA